MDKDHPHTLRYCLHVGYIQKGSSSHRSLTILSTKIVHPSAHKLPCWTFFGVCCVQKLHHIQTLMRTYFEECPPHYQFTYMKRLDDYLTFSSKFSKTFIIHWKDITMKPIGWCHLFVFRVSFLLINESLYYLTPSQRNLTCFDTYEAMLIW